MKKTKKDVALIVILLALAGVCFFLFSAVGKREGAVALVSVDCLLYTSDAADE